ncbi:N-acetylmuramic acid 6-phosphate etherase [Spongorhabdus nitratireducens]
MPAPRPEIRATPPCSRTTNREFVRALIKIPLCTFLLSASLPANAGYPAPTHKVAAPEMQGTSSENIQVTEAPSDYHKLESMSVEDILQSINREDIKMTTAVASQLPVIQQLALQVTDQLQQGRRLFYIGAGTSGRLSVMTVSNYYRGSPSSRAPVNALIAGGDYAITRSREEAEDSAQAGWNELSLLGIQKGDYLVGVSASGSTPYVLNALQQARQNGVVTASIVCNPGSGMAAHSNHCVEVITGPEIISGSTRMKAGSAQHQVLNMLTSPALQLARLQTDTAIKPVDSEATLNQRVLSIQQSCARVPECVSASIPRLTKLTTEVTETLKNGGRVFYIETRSSGGWGMLDASELLPTYSFENVIPVIAGGATSVREGSPEAAETSLEQCWEDLQQHNPVPGDFVLAIASTRPSPYVIGGLEAAWSRHINTGCIVCRKGTALSQYADSPVEIELEDLDDAELETITSGTAQKLALNMVSTTAMIQLGRVKGDSMMYMNMQGSQKLRRRGARILMSNGVPEADATELASQHPTPQSALETWQRTHTAL